ncbi:MAG TPA: CRISPR-associated protein Csx16 [Gammaproteobacteria bacterium]|nr:CRISPR-associated protein Csx16 [Gammaproteobacteria bacterium]
MTTWFVTRHSGARDWAARRDLSVDQVVEHLSLDDIESGDHVIGTLPVNLVAELNERGARYFHLVLPLPSGMRGQEIDADTMERLGARLEEYHVDKR